MKKEDGELGALGKVREGLPEVGHDSFKDWEPILYKLWEKLREHTQDLQSIVQDQLRLTVLPAYKVYTRPTVDNAEVATFTPELDPNGVKRMIFQGKWNSENQAYLKKMDRQEQDKVIVLSCTPFA